jgi:hypothetical protein
MPDYNKEADEIGMEELEAAGDFYDAFPWETDVLDVGDDWDNTLMLEYDEQDYECDNF